MGRGGFAAVAAVGATIVATLAAPVGAATATLFVATTGSDSNSCLDALHPCLTLNGVLAQASPGDTINVGAGTYTSASDPVVDLTKSVTLNGGWDPSFTSQT